MRGIRAYAWRELWVSNSRASLPLNLSSPETTCVSCDLEHHEVPLDLSLESSPRVSVLTVALPVLSPLSSYTEIFIA